MSNLEKEARSMLGRGLNELQWREAAKRGENECGSLELSYYPGDPLGRWAVIDRTDQQTPRVSESSFSRASEALEALIDGKVVWDGAGG